MHSLFQISAIKMVFNLSHSSMVKIQYSSKFNPLYWKVINIKTTSNSFLSFVFHKSWLQKHCWLSVKSMTPKGLSSRRGKIGPVKSYFRNVWIYYKWHYFWRRRSSLSSNTYQTISWMLPLYCKNPYYDPQFPQNGWNCGDLV